MEFAIDAEKMYYAICEELKTKLIFESVGDLAKSLRNIGGIEVSRQPYYGSFLLL